MLGLEQSASARPDPPSQNSAGAVDNAALSGGRRHLTLVHPPGFVVMAVTGILETATMCPNTGHVPVLQSSAECLNWLKRLAPGATGNIRSSSNRHCFISDSFWVV